MLARGGMYDVVGGGFSRYSTDNFWRVPHFEKMLYDNALLVRAYLHAWQITKEPAFKRLFQSIAVQSPTQDEAIAILRGVKARYEIHHSMESYCSSSNGRKQPSQKYPDN